MLVLQVPFPFGLFFDVLRRFAMTGGEVFIDYLIDVTQRKAVIVTCLASLPSQVRQEGEHEI